MNEVSANEYDDLTSVERETARNESIRIIDAVNEMLDEAGWFEMSISEQVDFTGFSPESLETYNKYAMELATRHFYETTVTELIPHRLGINYFSFYNGENLSMVERLLFIAIDSTGREAWLTFSIDPARSQHISIETRMNDFIEQPGGVG